MSKADNEVEVLMEVERLQAEEDLNALMSTPAGKRFVWRVLEVCKVFHECNTGNSQTFTNLGRRQVGLWLMDELTTTCPEKYLEMYSDRLKQIQREKLKEEESDG